MSNIKLFESKQIRSVWNEEEQKWYFGVEDVVAILTDSNHPNQNIKRMSQRDQALAVETKGGMQKTGCANSQGPRRIVQSIPSNKGEPFKLWLAQVGSDRLDEIENPELATQRSWKLKKRKVIENNNLYDLILNKYNLTKAFYTFTLLPRL